jgi:ABC-2 type transport system permease protein
MKKFFRDFFILFIIQFKVFRQIGIIALVISAFLPFLLIIFMKLVTTKLISNISDISQTVIFLITGNVILGVSNLCIIMLGQSISSMKELRAFEYYSVLPISKLSLVLGILFSYLTITFPGFILLLFGGSFIFGFKINLNIFIFLVLILVVFSFTGLGAAIGVYSRSQLEANLFSQIIGLGLILITPVFYPIEILPKIFQLFMRLFPTTYGAEALRFSISGTLNTNFYVDILMLLMMSIFSFYLTNKKLRWQQI